MLSTSNKISEYDVSECRYDIALFHLEQAAQLAIKAYLLREVGIFHGFITYAT